MTTSLVTSSSVANAPPVPDPADAPRQGFPADYFALMQECWSEDQKKRPTAEQAHRRLLLLDPSARAVQGPLVLWHPARARAPSSLLDCILDAMQAQPGQCNEHVAPMLQAMVDEVTPSFCCSVEKFTKIYKIPTPLKLKSGKKWGGVSGGGNLVQDWKGVRVNYRHGGLHVLLRRRA
jgi:hypothetical protein